MDSSTVIKHVLLISCLPPWITPSHRAVSHQRVASVGPGHCWHNFLIHFVYNSWHTHCSHWSGCCQMLKISKVRWFKICSLTFMLFILFTLFIMIAVVATGLEGHPRLLDTPLQIPAHLGEILRYILSSRSRVCPGVQWYISTRSQARGVLLVWCPNHLNCFSIRRSRGYNPSLSQIVELLKLSWRVNHAALLRNLITTPWTWDLFFYYSVSLSNSACVLAACSWSDQAGFISRAVGGSQRNLCGHVAQDWNLYPGIVTNQHHLLQQCSTNFNVWCIKNSCVQSYPIRVGMGAGFHSN